VLRLYDYAASGNCYKARLALAQLGREYERVPVDIFAGETLSAEHAARNPALATPVLELAPGTYLPESGAILLYLAEGTDLLPGDPVERAQVHRWMFFEQANVLSVIAATRFRLLTGRLGPETDEARRLAAIGNAIAATANAWIDGREFFAAERYTVADIALYAYLHVAHEAGVAMEPHTALAAWMERVRERPGRVADLGPYPENARPGKSRSLYDVLGM